MKYFCNPGLRRGGRCGFAAPGVSLVWVAGVLGVIALGLIAAAPAFGAPA